jgi:hypothetical protein
MKLKIILLLAIVLSISVANAGPNDILVKNLKLYVNCEEYWIKAMCYTPTPLGVANNGGLCSNITNSFGQKVSACVDQDYFDGSNTTEFSMLWDRDFPLIKALGKSSRFFCCLLVYFRYKHTSYLPRQSLHCRLYCCKCRKSHWRTIDYHSLWKEPQTFHGSGCREWIQSFVSFTRR